MTKLPLDRSWPWILLAALALGATPFMEHTFGVVACGVAGGLCLGIAVGELEVASMTAKLEAVQVKDCP